MNEDAMVEVVARYPARLKELRLKAGLSQTELAKRAGIPQSAVAAYEVGRNSPAWGYCVRLAHALGVSLDAFLVAPEPPKESKQNST